MSEHTPLDPKQLSPAAQRALGPGPGKTMAARGMLPLPPLDQLAVLYQLSLDGDATIAQAARETAAKLPDKLLQGTLADPSNDPRVLDYFGLLTVDKPAVFDAIVLNPATADQTIAALAGKCGAREVDLISQNEQRILRTPEIIAAMYMNRKARMSTIDRVVELAVRNQVRVPGLAAWDEVARAISGSMDKGGGAETDELFDAVVADRDDSELTTGDADQAPVERGETVDKYLELNVTFPGYNAQRYRIKNQRSSVGSAPSSHIRIENAPAQWMMVEIDEGERGAVLNLPGFEPIHLHAKQSVMLGDIKVGFAEMPFRDLPMPAKIRAATLGDAFVRNEAIRDANRMVAMSAIKSPGVTDAEAANYAGNQLLSEDVIRYIAARREWTKLYGVKISLCRNPKAPIAETARLMPFLRERDLDGLIKSKGIPSAVVAQARKLQMQRRGGAKK
jgi:hypothetical protein